MLYFLDADVVRMKRARLQPTLPFTGIDLPAMMEEVCSSLFPDLPPVPVSFVRQGPLACIMTPHHPPTRDIYLHEVLNTEKTPEWVFRAILVHELLHVFVPSRKIDGRWIHHPPEFEERQLLLVPHIDDLWTWLFDVLDPALVNRPEKEAIWVRRDWSRRLGRSRSRRDARLRPWLYPPHLRAELERREDARAERAARSRWS